jgi:DNA-binding MarR family transcriptional regulator
MTAPGRAAFRSAMTRQRRWAQSLAEGLSNDSVKEALHMLRELRNKLEGT